MSLKEYFSRKEHFRITKQQNETKCSTNSKKNNYSIKEKIFFFKIQLNRTDKNKALRNKTFTKFVHNVHQNRNNN